MINLDHYVLSVATILKLYHPRTLAGLWRALPGLGPGLWLREGTLARGEGVSKKEAPFSELLA